MASDSTKTAKGPLCGVKIVEFGGIGPGPLCAMLLADSGASIIRIDRQRVSGLGSPTKPEFNILHRSRKSVAIDIKNPEGRDLVFDLISKADALLDPFRPGTMERLGLGPEICLAQNPKLVYTRITGWGQTGRLAKDAGHDINYLAITGILNAIGARDGRPLPPLNLVADMGAGAMFGAYGTLAAILEARSSGIGQVVDAAMVDGAAYLATGIFGLNAKQGWVDHRESNIMDGGAPFYGTYRTADNKYMAVGPIEEKFYNILIDRLGLDADTLPQQLDREAWPEIAAVFESVFESKTRDQWSSIFAGLDACVAPVLTFAEAANFPHNKDRQNFISVAGIDQPAPAPRFSRTPGAVQNPPSMQGGDTDNALAEWGISTDQIARLRKNAIIGTKT